MRLSFAVLVHCIWYLAVFALVLRKCGDALPECIPENAFFCKACSQEAYHAVPCPYGIIAALSSRGKEAVFSGTNPYDFFCPLKAFFNHFPNCLLTPLFIIAILG